MIRLFALIFLLVPQITWSQPISRTVCPNRDGNWDNCFGRHQSQVTLTTYVGQWQRNRRHGLGIEYSQTGLVLQSGWWVDGELKVSSTTLDHTNYPFRGPILSGSSDNSNSASIRSMLPQCVANTNWNECFGRYKGATGFVYVGEWNQNNRHGLGIEYSATGVKVREGKWAANELVEALTLQDDRFKLLDKPSIVETARIGADLSKAERDRLSAEVEAERKKRQELEERLAIAENREREQRNPSSPTQVASPKNPHALIIGNAAYPGSSRLDNPINDARAIEQKLKSMGFIVTVVTDANRQRLVQAMSQFRKTASNADLSLLFYSGHGVQIFGTNYILPIDVDQSDVAQATIQGVSLNSVVENFLPGKTKIVFLDACRDNPLQRSNDRSVSRGLAPISVAQGTLIAYATKDGQTASDGVGQKNSPFTKALLEHLSDPQDIAVILRKVREKVMTATGGKQQPWEYGSLTGGELVLSGLKK